MALLRVAIAIARPPAHHFDGFQDLTGARTRPDGSPSSARVAAGFPQVLAFPGFLAGRRDSPVLWHREAETQANSRRKCSIRFFIHLRQGAGRTGDVGRPDGADDGLSDGIQTDFAPVERCSAIRCGMSRTRPPRVYRMIS